ncbi:MAG: S9 family peptidase [Myxococcales bacterium]|nr:S9 family peptidase [Myxococcales bacterium]
MSMRLLHGLALAAALTACAAPQPKFSTEAKPMNDSPAPTRFKVLDRTASPITIERMAAFPPPGWQVPRLVRFSPDRKLVTYLKSESADETMALFALDRATGEHRVIVRAADLSGAVEAVSKEEELRRERQRKRIEGVTAYAWAKTANVLMMPHGDGVFVRDAEGRIQRVVSGEAIDPKLCADGSKIAFTRGREVWLADVATQKLEALTKDAPVGTSRGVSDFNMQEEFHEPSGLFWSPSCDKLAYLEVDERPVAELPVLGYRKGVELEQHRYPRAGAKNPVTTIAVIDLKSKKTTRVAFPSSPQFDATDQYLGRFAFSESGDALYFQRLSRDQKHLAIVRAETNTGAALHLTEHHETAWADMTELWTVDGGRIVVGWALDGHNHLALLDGKTGKLERQLTSGAWDVSRVVGVDRERGRVVFIGNRDNVIGRELFAVDLKGQLDKLSRTGGVHDVQSNDVALGYVDIHSAHDRLPVAEVFGGDGALVGAMETGKDADPAELRPATLVTIPGSADAPELYGALLEPRNKQPGVRYPAIVMVYGGPAVQMVLDDWNPRVLWQHLADRGFVVFQLDNRGSAGRGRQFEAPIYGRMGEVELADQLRGLEYLKGLASVDPERVGIYGHSYGGYMAAMAMLRAPDQFKVGVAGSPVTDWQFYDSGYTERYMGTPAKNPTGYANSALTGDAKNLSGKLFLIHALMDENVHFQHTAKLIDALVQHDKDFDLLVFPGERHGYRSPTARKYAFRRVIDYFVENL